MSDKEALPVQYGCHCDLEPGMKPDSCVLDMGPAYHSNCTYAPRLVRERKGRDDCEHWQPIKVARAEAAAAAIAQRDAEIAALREQVEALKKDAARYAYIKSQMEAGAVETQLPLCRSLFWVGTHVDCGDVRHADAAIDEAIAGNQPWNRVAAAQAAPPRQDEGEIPRC